MNQNYRDLHNNNKFSKLKKFFSSFYIILTFLVALLFIFILLVIFFINKKYYLNSFFDSDGAAELMLGKLLSDTGGIISKEWYYSTEVRVLHNQIILKILFKFSNNPFIIQPYLSTICALLMGGSAFFCFKTLKLSIWKCLLVACIIIMPLSIQYFMFFLANCYYSFFVINTFLYIGFFIISTDNNNKYQQIVSRLILCILSFLMGLCGPRYFLLIFIPIFLYTMIQLFQINNIYIIKDLKKEKIAIKKTHIILVITCTLIAFLGYLIYSNIFLQQEHARSITGIAHFVGPISIMNKIYQIPEMFLTVLDIQETASIFSKQGIVQLSKIAFIVYFLYSIYFLYKKREYLSINIKKYILISACIVIVNLGILIFSGGIFESTQSLVPRYFLLGIFPILPAGMLIVDNLLIDKIKQCLALLIIIGMVLTSAYSVKSYAQTIEYNKSDSLKEVVDYLEDENLKMGYSSFSYANMITLLSQYSATTVPLIMETLNPDTINSNYHKLVPQQWLYPLSFDNIYNTKQGEYLVLDINENLEKDWNQFILEKEGQEVFKNTDFIVYKILD